MLIRQLFDQTSYTYSYLLADTDSGAALLIDPVFEQTDLYIQLLSELKLTLKYALDTHVHADHITALGALRERLGCKTLVSQVSGLACADQYVSDGDNIQCGNITLQVLTTPGHTDDSLCFYLAPTATQPQGYLFSGDTLLIRGTGRTDFQNGSAKDLYHSLFTKVLTLADNTVVYPAHDYKGWTQSSIGEEKANNPRLQVSKASEFINIMHNLKLANPKMMDVAIPANLQCGQKKPQPFDESTVNMKRHTALFTTAEQIQASDVAAIAAKGYSLIINNRPDNEEQGQPSSAELAKAAADAGIHYAHIPIQRSLPASSIAEMATQLQQAEGPSFAFCRTGTRSTNLWLCTLKTAERAQAIEHAKTLGYDLSLATHALQP
ncbi:TIGR01244 family sulfur transferase [Dasania marina]|uniref:TIGR01244 family sulfur transferase n=1 Tax=Dasania marina TaxID=471499 RepID=UPI0030D89BCF|tara:strand:+ start:74628 stop:75764 length:1137 start_codon:yes stop_codon:yes gene_type:complete